MDYVIVAAVAFVAGGVVTYFVARNNQKYLTDAFNIDDTIRREYDDLVSREKKS